MEQEKRKEYFIFTSIFWWMGFILFGVMMLVNKEVLNIPLNSFTTFLSYGLGGGLLLGGLTSGIILFARFFKRQKLFVKIMLCIFFPFTFAVTCHIGILSFLPYGIYNFIVMKKNKTGKKV